MASSQGGEEEEGVTFLEHTGPDVPLVPVPGSSGSKSSLVLKPTASPLTFTQKVDAKGNKYIYLHCTDMSALQQTLSSPDKKGQPLMVICSKDEKVTTDTDDLDLSNLELVADLGNETSTPQIPIKKEPKAVRDLQSSPSKDTSVPNSPSKLPPRYKVADREPTVTRSRNRSSLVADSGSIKKEPAKSKIVTSSPEKRSATPRTKRETVQIKEETKSSKKKTETPQIKEEFPKTKSKSEKKRMYEETPKTKLSKRQEALREKTLKKNDLEETPSSRSRKRKALHSAKFLEDEVDDGTITILHLDGLDKDEDTSDTEKTPRSKTNKQSPKVIEASTPQARSQSKSTSKKSTAKNSVKSETESATEDKPKSRKSTSRKDKVASKTESGKSTNEIDLDESGVGEMSKLDPVTGQIEGDIPESESVPKEGSSQEKDQWYPFSEPTEDELAEIKKHLSLQEQQKVKELANLKIKEEPDTDAPPSRKKASKAKKTSVDADGIEITKVKKPKAKKAKPSASGDGEAGETQEEGKKKEKVAKKSKPMTVTGEGDAGIDASELVDGADQLNAEPPVKKKRGRKRIYPIKELPEDYVPRNKRPKGVRRMFPSLFKTNAAFDPLEFTTTSPAVTNEVSTAVVKQEKVDNEHGEGETPAEPTESKEETATTSKENQVPAEESEQIEEVPAPMQAGAETFPVDDWTLHNGVFLNQDNVFRILLTTPEPMYEKVPDGIKENIYFTFDNSENVRRRREGGKSAFTDDCGVWAFKTCSTKKMEFILEENRLIFIIKKHGLYCRKLKKTFFPLAVQPRPEDLIIQRKYYATLKRDPQYRKRITWFETYPNASENLLNIALAEYLGKYPTEMSIHGNSKCSKTEYKRTDKAVLMRIAARVKGRKPKDVYQELVQQGPEYAPRDLKQVHNIKYNVEEEMSEGEEAEEFAKLMEREFGMSRKNRTKQHRKPREQTTYVIQPATYGEHDTASSLLQQHVPQLLQGQAQLTDLQQSSEEMMLVLQEKQEAAEVLQQIQANAHIFQQQHEDGQSTVINDGQELHILQNAIMEQPQEQVQEEHQQQQQVIYQEQETSEIVMDTVDDSQQEVEYVEEGQAGKSAADQQQTVYIIQEDGTGVAYKKDGQEQPMYILQDQEGTHQVVEEQSEYVTEEGKIAPTEEEHTQQIVYLQQEEQGEVQQAMYVEQEQDQQVVSQETVVKMDEEVAAGTSQEPVQTEAEGEAQVKVEEAVLQGEEIQGEEATEDVQSVINMLSDQPFLQEVIQGKSESPYIILYR